MAAFFFGRWRSLWQEPEPGRSNASSASRLTPLLQKQVPPVVPSHARQGLHQQIKSTPPNHPLACGKGMARLLGFGWLADKVHHSGSAEPCSTGALPANQKPPSQPSPCLRQKEGSVPWHRSMEVRSPSDAQALPERMHRWLRGLRRSHKPALISSALDVERLRD